MINKIVKGFKYLFDKIRFSFKEKRLGKLKYIYEQNGSDELIIVFSAFTAVPKYNYMKTLAEAKIDKIFILDNFGYRGSYYWYEGGKNTPNALVSKLMGRIIGEKKYKKIYTAGSSKGGTSAIYFGLKFNVGEVFCSACQYHVGDYLNTDFDNRKKIMEGMMGKNYTSVIVRKLNEELPLMIEDNAHSNTIINLYYSEKDNTYQKHIVYLMNDLKSAEIQYTTTIDDYVDHGDNGIYFSKHLKKRFS